MLYLGTSIVTFLGSYPTTSIIFDRSLIRSAIHEKNLGYTNFSFSKHQLAMKAKSSAQVNRTRLHFYWTWLICVQGVVSFQLSFPRGTSAVKHQCSTLLSADLRRRWYQSSVTYPDNSFDHNRVALDGGALFLDGIAVWYAPSCSLEWHLRQTLYPHASILLWNGSVRYDSGRVDFGIAHSTRE